MQLFDAPSTPCVLEHVLPLTNALEELNRVSKPGETVMQASVEGARALGTHIKYFHMVI